MESLHYRELEAERLEELVPAYFYVTTRQRNAWWGTRSSQYRGPASLTCTLGGAKSIAEDWRKQGSAFTIQRVPGLLVRTSGGLELGLVEFHSDSSFLSWDRVLLHRLRSGTPIRQVLRALGPDGLWRGAPISEHSFISGRVAEGEDVELIGPRAKFLAWGSHSDGSNYWLGWTERPGRHKADGVRRIARLCAQASGLE